VYTGRGEGNTRLWIKEPDQVAPHRSPVPTERSAPPSLPTAASWPSKSGDGRSAFSPLEGGSPLTLTDRRKHDRSGLGRRRVRLLRGGLGNQPNSRDGGTC
jgi:hypothetical protein